MKKKNKSFYSNIFLLLLSIFSLAFGFYLYPSSKEYRGLKEKVKILEEDLNYKKIETTSILDDIHQGQESLNRLETLERNWEEIHLPNFKAEDLKTYLFDTSLAYYPNLIDEREGVARKSPFYDGSSPNSLSRCLALNQTLGAIKKIDLETTLSANSALFRRIGGIEYFYNTKKPGSWYAIMKGHYKESPSFDQLLQSMRNQMEMTIALKEYINDMIGIKGSVTSKDLSLKKQLWLQGKKPQMYGDMKPVMNDVSLRGSFLWDTYSLGVDELDIHANAFTTDNLKGMFKAYVYNNTLYYLTCTLDDGVTFSYFTPSGLLMSVINQETSESYYLRDADKTDNHWAQIANLGYELIQKEIKRD